MDSIDNRFERADSVLSQRSELTLATKSQVTCGSEFLNPLAPRHLAAENIYLALASVRLIVHALAPPVLVVGAGQGLFLADLRRRGFQGNGLDLGFRNEVIRKFPNGARGGI